MNGEYRFLYSPSGCYSRPIFSHETFLRVICLCSFGSATVFAADLLPLDTAYLGEVRDYPFDTMEVPPFLPEAYQSFIKVNDKQSVRDGFLFEYFSNLYVPPAWEIEPRWDEPPYAVGKVSTDFLRGVHQRFRFFRALYNNPTAEWNYSETTDALQEVTNWAAWNNTFQVTSRHLIYPEELRYFPWAGNHRDYLDFADSFLSWSWRIADTNLGDPVYTMINRNAEARALLRNYSAFEWAVFGNEDAEFLNQVQVCYPSDKRDTGIGAFSTAYPYPGWNVRQLLPWEWTFEIGSGWYPAIPAPDFTGEVWKTVSLNVSVNVWYNDEPMSLQILQSPPTAVIWRSFNRGGWMFMNPDHYPWVFDANLNSWRWDR